MSLSADLQVFILLNKYFLGCGAHAQKGNNFVAGSRGEQGHGESRTRLCLRRVLSAGRVHLTATGSKAKWGPLALGRSRFIIVLEMSTQTGLGWLTNESSPSLILLPGHPVFANYM